jgi:hypothetical protein
MPTYYVATTGSDLNAGTESSPWSFAWAISNSNTVLQGGDTVYVMPGTYYPPAGVVRVDAYKAGTATAPIVYRKMPGEARPLLSFGLRNYASYTWYIGMEFVFLQNDVRVTNQPGSEPNNIGDRWKSGAGLYGAGQRYIQCHMRDCGNGIGTNGSQTWDAVFDECYIYNNGWIGPDRGHGHNAYLQSNVSRGRKVLRNSVLWCPYQYNVHIYGSDAAKLTGYDILENAIFLSGLPSGENLREVIAFGATVGNLGDMLFDRNSVVRLNNTGASLTVGSSGYNVPPDNLTFTNNVIRPATLVEKTASDCTLTFTGNIVYSLGQVSNVASAIIVDGALPYTNRVMDRNAYYKQTGDNRWFVNTYNTIAAWNAASGMDANSQMIANATGAPTEQIVLTHPSRYTLGRGHIHVHNTTKANTVSVDVGRIVPNGFPYAIYHVFDYVTGAPPTVTGIANGTRVTLPMSSKTPPTPYGGTALPTMDNTFGVFVVTARPGWTVTTRGGLG